jgi:hypothetical protein
MAEVTQQDILSRIASGEGWTPLQDVAPTTPDVAALVPLVQEGRVEYRRDKESRIEYGIFERGDRIYLHDPGPEVHAERRADRGVRLLEGREAERAEREHRLVQGPVRRGRQRERQRRAVARQGAGDQELTPMLMPVTVMHDPRTAVGTIADTKLLTPEKDGVPRARIDTVLALWGTASPRPSEAEANAAQGTLMQSMECYSPWYECSECGQVFHKLPGGAEQAMWCDHLKASKSAGFVDLSAAAAGQSPNASRILGDVCFTGTGLIFGSRGARGRTARPPVQLRGRGGDLPPVRPHVKRNVTTRSDDMGLVQIEQSELDTLRKERDDARAEARRRQDGAETATAKTAEQAEAAKTAAETERDTAEAEGDGEGGAGEGRAEGQALGALGEGFTAKLGDFTKARLTEQAGTLSDEEWDNRLKELEETAVKRDAEKDGVRRRPPTAEGDRRPVRREELASFNAGRHAPGSGAVREQERSSVIGSLAGAFKRPPEGPTAHDLTLVNLELQSEGDPNMTPVAGAYPLTGVGKLPNVTIASPARSGRTSAPTGSSSPARPSPRSTSAASCTPSSSSRVTRPSRSRSASPCVRSRSPT